MSSPVNKRACSELPWQPPSPLAHGLKGCRLGLLVLILKEKYFKEHLITVQGAVLLKMPMGLMYVRTWMGEPCLRKDQAVPLWGTRDWALQSRGVGDVWRWCSRSPGFGRLLGLSGWFLLLF